MDLFFSISVGLGNAPRECDGSSYLCVVSQTLRTLGFSSRFGYTGSLSDDSYGSMAND